MSAISFCLKNPVFASVIGIFIVLFGLISFYKIPYQLLPQTTRPTISVYTSWAGSSPYEIEKEITQPQEKYLKNIPQLETMTSTSRDGRSIINLTFSMESDLKMAFINVSSKLEEVGGYPADVEKPIVKTTGENIPIAIYLFVKRLDKSMLDDNALDNDKNDKYNNLVNANSNDIDTFRNFIYDNILQHYERVEGVGEVYVSGGVSREAQIFLNTKQLAFNNITIEEIKNTIQTQNINISSGSIDFKQRNYRIQTIGEFQSLDDVLNMIIKVQNGKIIRLKDIAEVKMGYSKKTSYNIHNNEDTISIQIRPTADANILDLTNNIQSLTATLNSEILENEGLVIEWGRDQRGFILNAIKQVRQSVLIGVVLSVIVLWVFLRNIVSLCIVVLLIPFSIIGTFIFLYCFGRTLNVISLAGICFAISMVIDCGIIVLESIIRHRRNNPNKPFEATFIGVKEILGALFASSITTIGIFVPIIYLKDEAGQLFKDIALASSGAIVVAFIGCALLIPAFLLYLLPKSSQSISPLSRRIGAFGLTIQQYIMQSLTYFIKTTKRRIITIVGFVGVCIIFSIATFPKIDYMPKGAQNFIVSYLSLPSGLSLNEKRYVVELIESKVSPFLSKNGYTQNDKNAPPAIKDFFISAQSSIYFYFVAEDSSKAAELIPFAKHIIDTTPNVSGVVLQQEIFAQASSSSIDLNISGNDLEEITQAALAIQSSIKENLPYLSIRAVPTIEANNREINLYPNTFALMQHNMNITQLGNVVDVALGGKTLGSLRLNQEYVDLVLKSSQTKENQSPDDILYSQIYTPTGRIITLGMLAELKDEIGISTIRHFEQKRNILLILNSNRSIPLEESINIIKQEIISPIKSQFPTLNITIDGNADKITQLRGDLMGGFLLAVVITYLILCVLYGNFFYPFFIILTVPLAIAGGLMGLFLTNLFIAPQHLDVITMLGFIMLVGSVVNNAILIVYQARINFNDYNMQWEQSVLDSSRTRLSPIAMSMATSVLALLPLVIFSGAGSEIYRGLGAVLVGGIAFSSIITIFIIPALLLCFNPKRKKA